MRRGNVTGRLTFHRKRCDIASLKCDFAALTKHIVQNLVVCHPKNTRNGISVYPTSTYILLIAAVLGRVRHAPPEV